MEIICGFRLDIMRDGMVMRSTASYKSITNAGYEFMIRSQGDPVSRPPIADTLGIGWGPGSTTPFAGAQTTLQGASTSLKPATWSYDPVTNLYYATLEATWPANDPSTSLIYIGEIGLFNSAGTMIDRTPITPTPKRPEEAAKVHGVIGFVQSESGFTLI